MLQPSVHTSSNAGQLLEVYPVPFYGKARYLNEHEIRHINKEFRRAAALFANRLAGAGRTNITKNIPLARILTQLIRQCDYEIFTKVQLDYPEALRARNLIFRLQSPDDPFVNYEKFPVYKTVLIPKPRRKISLPFETVISGGKLIKRSYIPLKNEMRVTLPLDKEGLASSPQTRNIAQSMNNSQRPCAQMKEEELARTWREAHNIVTEFGGRLDSPNRTRAGTKKGAVIINFSSHRWAPHV